LVKRISTSAYGGHLRIQVTVPSRGALLLAGAAIGWLATAGPIGASESRPSRNIAP
jgi:hypothetical protein